MTPTFNYNALYGFAVSEKPKFLARKPFPYVIIDGFLPKPLLDLAVEAFPKPDSQFWRRTDNDHTFNKLTPDGFFGTQLLKEMRFTDAMRRVFYELNCGLFLWFLRELTGIDRLMNDPFFSEGGYHCVGNEGKLDIHADFSHHSYLEIERRVNLLIYLNPEWREEWGGALKLYSPDLVPTEPIYPIMNRAVIFLTSETSFHGHPEPMKLPRGVWRRSIALYYYAAPRPEREVKAAVFPSSSPAAPIAPGT